MVRHVMEWIIIGVVCNLCSGVLSYLKGKYFISRGENNAAKFNWPRERLTSISAVRAEAPALWYGCVNYLRERRPTLWRPDLGDAMRTFSWSEMQRRGRNGPGIFPTKLPRKTVTRYRQRLCGQFQGFHKLLSTF